jgi:hypothetical protein
MPITIKTGRFGTTVVTMPDGETRKFTDRVLAKQVAEREANARAETVVDLDQPARAAAAARSTARRSSREAKRADRFELIAEERPLFEGEEDGPQRITLFALGEEASRWAMGLGETGAGEFERCGRDCAFLELEYSDDAERTEAFRMLRRSGLQYVFAHDYVPRGAQSKLITLREAQARRRADRRYRRRQRIASGNYQRGRR